MKWIISAMEGEYGKKKWNSMSEQEQVDAVAVFLHHYLQLRKNLIVL